MKMTKFVLDIKIGFKEIGFSILNIEILRICFAIYNVCGVALIAGQKLAHETCLREKRKNWKNKKTSVYVSKQNIKSK